MPEGRDTWILVRLEPSFKHIVDRLTREAGMSASSYARGAILRDLYARGLLSAELLLRVTSMSTSELNLILREPA